MDIFLAVVVVIVGVAVGVSIGQLLFAPFTKKYTRKNAAGDRCKRK